MDLLIIGLGVGLLLGLLFGIAYVHWRVARIVDNAILEYRADQEKRKFERLKQFLNDMEDGGEENK